ncbi:MAG: fumarylacetoacetate hydrolase family protein [Elusimicrobia bacterium]|nr:fumarylacetoacetate hydrolase family protein [Elusimicrobiota bacterium]
MKLVSFVDIESGRPSIGAAKNDKILDLGPVSEDKLGASMLELIENSGTLLPLAQQLLKQAPSQAWRPSTQLRLLAPLPNPTALKDCFAFEDHAVAGAVRRGETLPEQWYELPAYYKGNHRAIYGPEEEIPWPFYTRRLDFECEIACVIGKKGKNIPPEEAEKYLFGYMIFNDVSARDIQKKEMILRMGPAKGKDFANVFGPYLVTADEVHPEKDFSMTVRVNGEIWSEGHFKDQYWGFPLLISHLSQEETIFPGDVVGSGTFYKGCGLDLNRWIQPGDILELEVPKLGILRNKIGAPAEQRQLNYKRARPASHAPTARG